MVSNRVGWGILLSLTLVGLASATKASSGAEPPSVAPSVTALPEANATFKSLDVDRYFASLVLPPKTPGTVEATVLAGPEGSVYLVYPSERDTVCQIQVSTDAGRNWGAPRQCVDGSGKPIRGLHISLIRLKSGKLGLIHSSRDVPAGRTGRDGGTVFRTSDDEGRTWSDPIVVERRFGICAAGHAVVLSNGRIVVPMFKWLSHDATGVAESSNSPSLSYSYTYVSDDEGKTWTESLSELFVSHDRASYDLEEPAVIELKDGRLLMHLRSQLGRMYRSYSKDRGISWSRPESLPFAAGYAPCALVRIPTTGDLLLSWNQVSRNEILTGLHRHRLSCAISKDDGETWQNFKNLESLDDTTLVKPTPANRYEVIEMWEDYGYYQPVNRQRYHRAPGVVRIVTPSIAFVGDEAVIVYDYGEGTLGVDAHGTKLRAVPISWFYE